VVAIPGPEALRDRSLSRFGAGPLSLEAQVILMEVGVTLIVESHGVECATPATRPEEPSEFSLKLVECSPVVGREHSASALRLSSEIERDDRC
jgi:hypothetical protein